MRLYLAMALMLALTGCLGDLPPATQVINATGTNLDKAQAHNDTAEKVVQKVKPHADKTGQELVDVVSGEHKAVDQELSKARQDLTNLQKIDQQKDGQITGLREQITALKSMWGYKLQVMVQAFLTTIIIVYSLHFLFGLSAMILPLFFPATLVAVPLLKKLAAICNPAAWFQFMVDHVHVCPTVVAVKAS